MAASANHRPVQRLILAALAAGAALTASGQATAQAAGSETAASRATKANQDPVQRLMVLATKNAFSRLTTPEGFWDSRVARFGLPVLFRKTAANANTPLAQDAFRVQLQHRLNILAEQGARGALPTVLDRAGKLPVTDSWAVLHGKPSAGATRLRLDMGSDLVNAMIPPLEQAILSGQDAVIAQAVASLSGVSARDVAQSVALAADNGIWYEIGRAEAAIRADPQAAGDAELTAALRPAPASAQAPASSPAP